MKKISIFAKVGFKTILFVFLPLLAVILITAKTSAILHIRSFIVLTGSMQPTIPIGSVAFVHQQSRYQLGDVVTYKKGNVTVTHRVIQIVEDASGVVYRTQGDANNTPDGELVKQANVIGKGIFQIQYIGKILLYIKTLPGFIAFIITPSLMLIAVELWNIKKEIEKQTREKLLKQLKANGMYVSV